MENFVEVESGKLWSCVNGKLDGPVVLLCSGGPGCCDYLAPVSEMLEHEYCVIRFEQRGCGRSVCDGNYGLETAVEDIESIRKFYKVKSWAVGGHSWGANLALVYALQHPASVDSILYIAGNGIHNDRHWSEEYHSNRNRAGETVPPMENAFNDEVNAQGNASLRSFGRRPCFYKDISALQIRTLFIMAENDIRPSWPVEQLYNLMPKASYARILHAEHFIWLGNGEALKRELLFFLESGKEEA